MQKHAAYALILALTPMAWSAQSRAQAVPVSGSVVGHEYRNQDFGLTWEFPEDWVVTNLAGGIEVDASHSLLRLLPGGSQSPESIQLSYAELSPDLDQILERQVEEKGWEPVPGRGSYTLGGVPTQRSDYKSKEEPTRYLTMLVGPRHGYELTLAFAAASTDRVQELINTALRMKIQPDWPPGAQGDPVLPTTPGAVPRRVRVSQGVTQGLILAKVAPKYSNDARKARVQGSVVMLAHIGADGLIKDLYVEYGHPLLVPAAIEAVSQWRYRPYLLQGTPVEVETQMTVNFTLQ